MDVNPMKGISNFPQIASTPPANVPDATSGEIPANDNLKHSNVQVKIEVLAPDYLETPSGSKTKINFLA